MLTDKAKFSRNEIVQFLEKNNIQTRNLFAGNMLRHPMFEGLVRDIDYRVVGSLENTDKIMERAFWIGVYPGLGDDEINYTIEKIREFVRNNR
jgi:CDP-6-deoxy-D-xylo-4-hexulose-3-dehydrase